MSHCRRWWILALCVAPVAALTLLVESPAVHSGADPPPALVVPAQIGAFEGRDVALSARTLELLGADRVLNRQYRDAAGRSVHLCIVEARSRTAIHPPEVCYRGWGYEAEDSTRVSVPLPSGGELGANLLFLAKPDRRVAVLYWYRAGGENTTSFLAQQMRWVLRLPWNRGREHLSALVRLSTAIDSADAASRRRAVARLVELASRLAERLDRAAPRPAADVEESPHQGAP